MYKVDIVMPIYHSPKITIDAVDSVYAHTEDVDFRIIAVVDGYDRQLIKYFKTRKDAKVIYHRYSKGFIKSVNEGLLEVRDDADYIMLLNNDVLIEDDRWLINLVKTFDGKTGAVGPISDYVMGLQNQVYEGFPQIHYTKLLIGFCILVRKDVFDLMGKLDERFGMGGNDDLDISLRMRLLGYDLKINRGVFVHHIGSVSLPMTCNVSDLDQRTRGLLDNKWNRYVTADLFMNTNDFILKGE